MRVNQRRLPAQCPVPYDYFSDVIKAIDNSQITGIFKIRLIRQAASFYHGMCPKLTHDEYVGMAKTLCDHYTQLKDKQLANNANKHSRNYYVSHYDLTFTHTVFIQIEAQLVYVNAWAQINAGV